MKTHTLHALPPLHSARDFHGGTLALLFFQNEKKSAAVPAGSPAGIAELAKSGVFSGSAKSAFFLRSPSAGEVNLLAAGLGAEKDFTPEKARQTGAVAASKIMAEKEKKIGIDVDHLLDMAGKARTSEILPAFLEGFYLAQYSFDRHKTQKNTSQKIESVALVSRDRKLQTWLDEISFTVLTTVDCVELTRDFSNEPSNIGTPEHYANEIAKLCKTHGLKCRVLGEAEAKKEKMDLFLAVGKGSDREAKIVIMEYTPKSSPKKGKHIAFVGKGVTFDSGGISIKPSMRMEDMKHDMTGAATMAGATLLAARLGSKNRITTILAFTENMPSGKATQPGNIIKTRNGKTVEIINTDAEGRLVLADALDLAHDYEPDVIVDSATLTGASSIALGKLASALFSNDEKLAEQILKASTATEEALWQLPLWDEYFEDLKSQYADMMNSANDSNGGTIRGAVFLKQFIKPGMKWAHIDLANRAYDQGYLPYNPRKGSSGVYVRTFAEFLMSY